MQDLVSSGTHLCCGLLLGRGGKMGCDNRGERPPRNKDLRKILVEKEGEPEGSPSRFEVPRRGGKARGKVGSNSHDWQMGACVCEAEGGDASKK